MAYTEAQLVRLLKNAEMMGNHWDVTSWQNKLDKLRAANTNNDGDSND